MADAQSQPSTPSTWDWTRFPYPAHYLKPNKAMCAICQENFTEPRVIRRILYEAEPLRILGCGHVYHVSSLNLLAPLEVNADRDRPNVWTSG